MAKNKVTTGIHNEPDSFDRDPKTMKSRKNGKQKELKSMKLPKQKDACKRPGYIISKLNHSQELKYGDTSIVVPARCRRGQLKIGDQSKLKLMKGIQVVDIKAKSIPKK